MVDDSAGDRDAGFGECRDDLRSAVASGGMDCRLALVFAHHVLYARTRNLWDCVAAHAITNGMLGVYIVLWQDWTLW